jgi:hypothetical protein
VRAMSKTIRLIWGAALVAMIVGCGGGGGSGGTPVGGGDDDGGGGNVVAADLTLVLDRASITNASGSTVTATATAVDANRNVLADIPVTMSVDSNATVQVSGAVTDENGVTSGTVGIGSDRSNRIVTITAISGDLQRTASFSVVGSQLQATPVPQTLSSGGAGEIQYRVLDSNSVPMQGVRIVVSAPGGVESEGETDFNGRFDFEYTAPTAPGPFAISATAAGVLAESSLVVSGGTTSIPVVTAIVRSSSIAANPDVVQVNSDTSNNQVEVRALFIGDENAAIKNIRVRFDLDGDANSIGGTIASGSFVVYSDASGVARTSYKPGSRSSGSDAVTVRACWDYKDFDAGSCPNSLRARIVVVNEPLSISIGTDGLVVVDDLFYVKRFAVQVVDSALQAKAGAKVTGKLDLPVYWKGEWLLGESSWVYEPRAACDNEDLNRSGNIDLYSNGADEDANGTGKLEPRAADVSFSFEGSDVTNSSGYVIIAMRYPQSIASWVEYTLTVSAGVSGSEGSTSFSGLLPVDATEVSDTQSSPPFTDSPYGLLSSPVTLVTNPDGVSGLLCTDPD